MNASFTSDMQPIIYAPVPAARFTTIVLGAGGGLREDNLSAYLIAPTGSADYIALDAGSLLSGIRKAVCSDTLTELADYPADTLLTPEGWFLCHRIKAYLITHAHLDHLAGLVMNSPEDTQKAIYGLPRTIDYLRDHLFNGKIWPNFGNEGTPPCLNKYHYTRVEPGQAYSIANTAMSVEPFVLDHLPNCPSTAYLIHSAGAYVLYCGDTAPDALGKSGYLNAVWTRVAPLIRDKKLCGIFLESSHPAEHPDELLFGHLTPSWVMDELHRLATVVDPYQPDRALRDLKVVVTHIKPSLQRGSQPKRQIATELQDRNDLGVRFIIPSQGQRIEL